VPLRVVRVDYYWAAGGLRMLLGLIGGLRMLLGLMGWEWNFWVWWAGIDPYNSIEFMFLISPY
jgi:hypothetical protein